MILFEKKYQTFDTVFHDQMKHLEVRQKYSVARRILNSLLLDILHHLFSLVGSLFYNLVLVLRQDIISTLIVVHVL